MWINTIGTTQYERVEMMLEDNAWFTLADLHNMIGDPEASISARIRDMRKRGITILTYRMKNGQYAYSVPPEV